MVPKLGVDPPQGFTESEVKLKLKIPSGYVQKMDNIIERFKVTYQDWTYWKVRCSGHQNLSVHSRERRNQFRFWE